LTWPIDETLARDLVDRWGTPLMVTSESVIERNYQALHSLLPGVSLFYAVKANPDQRILATLAGLGAGLDVASPAELALTRQLSMPASRVLYTQPIKKLEEIASIRKLGIDLLICDNECEMRKIASVHPGCRVMIRIRVTNPYCVVNLSEKFGCEVEQVESLARLAGLLGLKLAGICFHVGSQTISHSPHVETLKIVKGIANDLALAGNDLQIVDIGGGFPLSYINPIISIDSFCGPIANTIGHLFGAQEIWAEPGRFIVGDAATLLVRIVGTAHRDGMPWYYIDDGLYGSLSGKVFDHADYPIRTFRDGDPGRCVIAGPTCDSFDIPFRDRSLSALEVGDIICVDCIGAYSVAHATRFNGIPPARRVFVTKEGEYELFEPDAR
jgi:ornithine decarboxylase